MKIYIRPLIFVAILSASLFLMNAAFGEIGLGGGQIVTVDKFGICKKVTNNNALNLFIPTNTAAEWTAFRTYAPNVVLNNCEFTITASAGAGGSISPSGAVAVVQGNNQAFTISPSVDYSISSVLVDSVNQGAISSYTFTNVQAGHTISASFTYTPPPASCSLPWGGTLASGSSVTAYLASSVPYGSSCTSETRTCTNGSLSGSYTNQSCTVQPPASCSSQTITWSGPGGGTNCSGSITGTGSGSFSGVNNTVLGKQGNARFDCSNGTWTKNDPYSTCYDYCPTVDGIFRPITLIQNITLGTRYQCSNSTWVDAGSGALPAGFCATATTNYLNDTLGILGSQCYNCSWGSWVPLASSYCPTY